MNLSTPANGEITSCGSGRVGVGYEGDTCNFTCNNGYELLVVTLGPVRVTGAGVIVILCAEEEVMCNLYCQRWI